LRSFHQDLVLVLTLIGIGMMYAGGVLLGGVGGIIHIHRYYAAYKYWLFVLYLFIGGLLVVAGAATDGPTSN